MVARNKAPMGKPDELAERPVNVPAVTEPDEWLPLGMGDQDFRVIASFDTSSEEGQFRLSKVLNAASVKKEQWPERRFICRDVVLHNVASPNRNTGKMEVRTRTVLIGPGGELAGFQSKGVLGSLGTLFAQFGRPPWIPALILEWDQVPAALGNVAKLFAVGRLDK